ncbi:MAG: hypothetical protein KAR06_03285 [Deltaproteobacteria bacterium]|nr:hypothetical protein [Deltaproteobacteria bacterium]
MKKILLTKRSGEKLYALVDDEDFERVSQFKWHCSKDIAGFKYASRASEEGTILMHRFIMGASKGQKVGHKSKDGLNNQRENLRVCTWTQIQAGKKNGKNNQTGYKGVSWFAEREHYIARIGKKNKMVYLGSFDDPVEAAAAYNKAAQELHGEFAELNKV